MKIYYKDNDGNKYNFKPERSDLTVITEEEFYAKPKVTEEIKAKQEKRLKIMELKNNLAATDYKAIKYAEGELTAEEYAETKAQRKAWREEINELENK